LRVEHRHDPSPPEWPAADTPAALASPTGAYCGQSGGTTRSRYQRRRATPAPSNNSVRRTYDLLRSTLPYLDPNALLVEEELVSSLSASRNTVRVVLQSLAAEGLVKRGPKVGTTVGPSMVLPISELMVLSDIGSVRTIQHQILESVVIAAPALVQRRLELDDGAPVAVIEGLLRDDTAPLALAVSYVSLPAGYADHLGKAGPEVVAILEEELDVEIGDSDSQVAAVLCDAQTAAFLDVVEGGPILWLEDLLRDTQGRPRALSHVRYRADRVTFSATAWRRGSRS
jgi:GntR family transcriptional regulator